MIEKWRKNVFNLEKGIFISKFHLPTKFGGEKRVGEKGRGDKITWRKQRPSLEATRPSNKGDSKMAGNHREMERIVRK
jgi:hypothetical protein